MSKTITNMDELEKVLMPTLQKMIDKLADEVYETLNYFLYRYYESYTPLYYDRMFDFLHSAVKVSARVKNGMVVAYVYIDYEAMNNYEFATGLDVVRWANKGLHGGQKLGNNTPHVWDDTIKSLIKSGKLLNDAADYLRHKCYDVK